MQKIVFFNVKAKIKHIQQISCQIMADLDSPDCPEKINIWLPLTIDFIQTCCADTVGR